MLQQLIASGTHVVGSDLTQYVEPAVVLFLRAGLVSIAYSIILLIGRKRFPKPTLKDLGVITILGLLNIPINQFLFLTSLKLTTAPHVALAYAMTPVFVLIIAYFFLKEKITKLKALGVALAISGAALIIAKDGLSFTGDGLLGDGLAFTASLSWALYTIVGKKPSQKLGAFYTTGMAMIVGFILYVPIFAFLPNELTLEDYSMKSWGQISYLAFMTSGVAYALWYHALTKLEASKVSVFNNMQPILTTILSIIFLGFALTWGFVLGALLIIAGVVVTQRG
jgi:drug/metabolite transporter (DMT)-like permease